MSDAERQRLRDVAEEVRAAFPHPLDRPELVLIDVDPRYFHAFWALPPTTVDAARDAMGAGGVDAPTVLRVYEVGDDGASGNPFDVEVVGLQGQCYVDIWDEPRRYRAELGLLGDDGRLATLADSAPVELPRLAPGEAAPAAVAAPAATIVEEVRAVAAPAAPIGVEARTPVRHPVPPPPEPPSTVAPERLTAAPGDAAAADAPVDAAAPPPSALPPGPAATAAERPEPVRHPFPLPPTESAEFDPALLTASPPTPPPPPAARAVAVDPASPVAAALPAAASAPVDAAPPVEVGDRTPPAAPAAEPWNFWDAEPVAHPFPLPPSEASEFVPELLTGGAAAAVEAPPAADAAAPAGEAPGASAQPAPPPPPAGEAEGLPLEAMTTLSSWILGRETVELEINAELHVFGRARPGTRLQLFGRRVPLRPDGTFSVYRPLPQGAVIVSALLSDDGPGDGSGE